MNDDWDEHLARAAEASDEADELLRKIEEAFEELQRDSDGIEEMAKAIMQGSVAAVIHDDAPLGIDDVLCLPEMGGAYTVSPEFRRKGENVNDNMIRTAVKDGRLTPLPLPAKKLLFSRKQIRTMLECPPTDPTQQQRMKAAPSPASQGAGRTHADPGQAALEAALRMAQGLKKR